MGGVHQGKTLKRGDVPYFGHSILKKRLSASGGFAPDSSPGALPLDPDSLYRLTLPRSPWAPSRCAKLRPWVCTNNSYGDRSFAAAGSNLGNRLSFNM